MFESSDSNGWSVCFGRDPAAAGFPQHTQNNRQNSLRSMSVLLDD
ncbi:MAG: hypothetical protein PF570_04805 [Candidatus Cloacimonetes bacterium]|nr:hypothetical protein [Candidatus Cloacimonadota bacterium]